MALTRPRAYQIYDIDYKQAVRVVAITNVTLSGGAPNTVDGVGLSLNDRVLVTGQSTGSQNGIYYVTTVGSGSNGTWTRSTDTNATGELLSGTIVMVTEGSTYADTQWKLITNDPITIGSTALTFVQNYLANSISFGQTSFAIGSSNANATVSVAGTANVVVFSSTGANITGTIGATGNITGGNLSVGTGTITVNNIVNSGSNGVGNIGSATTYFNTVFAKATSAQYADLAEMYQGDDTYMPGTVVEFGGTHEVTITTTMSSTSVAGVVSTNPSYLMNSGLTGLNTVPVALTGRVPCQVLGPVKKGDRLTSSVFPGVAQALDESTYRPGCIIGKALEDWTDTSVKLIEVVVGRV